MVRFGKGKGAATSTQARVAAIPEHPLVQLVSTDHKKEFVRLMQAPLLATRFLCCNWMRNLELEDASRALFYGTGFGSLYGMIELTYPSLTLEFLSSFNYDFGNQRVAFRLCNASHDLSLREFGAIFGFASGGLDRAPDAFDYKILWMCMCGTPPRKVSSLRISAIEHPALRLWFRTLGGTIFGRSEPGTTNKHELEILGSYLNVQRQAPFHLDLAHYVASHFVRVAKGKVSTIEIGGIITYIAKKFEGCDLTRYNPIGNVAPLLDRIYMTQSLKWTGKRDNYQWKIGDRWLQLPCSHLAPLARLPQAGGNENFSFPSYLVGAPLAIEAPPAHQGGNDQDLPRHETPPPSHDYQAPSTTQPSYSGNADLQWRIDYQLSMYPTYHEHVVQGRVPPGGPYPSYYTGPEGDYGGYPGRIFDNAGVSQSDWGSSFWSSQGGQGSGTHGNDGNDDDGGDDE